MNIFEKVAVIGGFGVFVVAAGCSPSGVVVCREALSRQWVCVDQPTARVDLVGAASPVQLEEYYLLTEELQLMLSDHYQRGGSDEAAMQAVADLINYGGLDR